MNKIPAIIFSSLIILANTSFAQLSDEFQKIIATKTCTALIDSVKHNWTFNKEKNYYQSKFTPSELTAKQIYLPCIKGIKKDDIKILFGEPSVTENDLWKYYTSYPHNSGFPDSYLTIEFAYNRVTKIYETNQKGIFKNRQKKIKEIKKHWKEKWKYIDSLGYYQMSFKTQDCEFLEKVFFATDSVKIKRKFGEPSNRKNENYWQYYNSNYYRDNKYVGEGIEILFKNGKVAQIFWLYSVPLIEKSGY